MGLLDGLLTQVMGQVMGGGRGVPGGYGGVGASATTNPMLQMVLQLIQQNGGIGGVLQKFERAGQGQAAQSWLAPGAPNQPINADILQQVLGSGALAEIAQQFGMSPQHAAENVASTLPGVIDHMTPDGSIPSDQHDQVADVLAQLEAMRARRGQ